MIEAKKVDKEEFNSCNCCGRYINSPSELSAKLPEGTNLYEYILRMPTGFGVGLRICSDCAKEFVQILNKQMEDK